MFDSDLTLVPPPGSDRDRDNRFYQVIGGACRYKALEAFLDLKVPELLGEFGIRKSSDLQ